MYSLIYFSPTGNALHLAKKLAGHLDLDPAKLLALEFVDLKLLKPDQHLVLIYPVHGFNAPRTVKRFVNELPPGLYNSISLIGVGSMTAWLNGAVSLELRKKLTQKGYSIVVDEMLAMPLTFIMAFPDKVAYQNIDESEKRIVEIGQSIVEGKESLSKVAGKSKVMNFLGKIEQPAARLFGLELHANKDCTSCGTCWENCPEKNIKKNSKAKPHFGFNCIMCMRCIYNCPEKAISPRVSKFIPIKQGYDLKKFRPQA